MRSKQPVADILLWDCDDHLEKKGGKRLFRMGQGDTKISMILYLCCVGVAFW